MVEIMLLLFQKYEDNVNMKTMYVGIWGIYGHIIVTLCEHCEMTHEKHSLSFAVKFHAKPNSARMWASSEHVRAAHCA